jgi:transcriptional regulator with XRE-family HTH domain
MRKAAIAANQPDGLNTSTMDKARASLDHETARVLEVSALSIWKWESGGASPRASRVPQILERLALGKREALALVTEVE